MSDEPKPWLIALMLCTFAGTLGAHRFYVGKTRSGIAMLVTFGGLGLWWLVDLALLATRRFRDAQGRPLTP